MPSSKAARLVNLVIALLSTRNFMTAAKIRQSVDGYGEAPTDEAFNRMFERDKAELRDLGVPLETGRVSRLTEDIGYRINRTEYELPPITLTPAEAAAAAVASALWNSPELASAAQSALTKLRAAGVEVDPSAILSSVGSVPTRNRGSEPALESLLSAVQRHRVVQFTYKTSLTGPAMLRTVDPWGVVSHAGRWYLIGFDHDRQAQRTYRLTRFVGDVSILDSREAGERPADTNLFDIVSVSPAVGESTTATIWIAAGKAHQLRRAGSRLDTRELDGRAGDVYEVTFSRRDWIVRTCVGHADDVIVLEPAEIRDAVIGTLTQVAGDL